MVNPPGHIPGLHIPGTIVPIPYALENAPQRPPMSGEEQARLDRAYVEHREGTERRIAELLERLQDAGVPLQERRQVVGIGKRLFSSKKPLIYGPVEPPAWPLGPLEWSQPETQRQGATGEHETGITAAGELVPMDEHGFTAKVEECRALREVVLQRLQGFAATHGIR